MTGVRYFTEIKWLVTNNPYEILIYSNHYALQDIFLKSNSKKAKINKWLNLFSEFNLRLIHQLSKDQYIDLADGLSQILTKLIDEPRITDLPEWLAMSITISLKI